MIVSPTLQRSLLAILLSSAALSGCSDGPRQEIATRVTRRIVVLDEAASSAPTSSPAAASAAPAPTAVRSEPRAAAASARVAERPKGDGKALSVKKLVLATQVEKASREPKGVGTSFKQGEFEKLYAFVELANPGDEAQVLVSFEPPSATPARGNVRLDVGTSSRWRTWASSRAVDEKGSWSAVVTAPDGRELAREKFEIL